MARFYLDLFSGIGGFALGAEWAGLAFDGHYFSEVDEYAARIYKMRFKSAVGLGDVRQIDYASLPSGEWFVSGGFPCQPHSIAGKRRAGEDERDLWPECRRMLRELRPRVALFENVTGIFVSSRGGYMKKWTEREIQFALTYSQRYSPFYIRNHIVVTNVSWGAGFNHELDLLSLSKSRCGTEVEIKVSVSDLKRDAQKRHEHRDPRIRTLYFAGPLEMKEALLEYAPENAGVISVELLEGWKHGSHLLYKCHIERKPKNNRYCTKFTEKEIVNLLRLGNMRFWTLLGKEFLYKEHGRENNV